jgi:hypothetical protein
MDAHSGLSGGADHFSAQRVAADGLDMPYGSGDAHGCSPFDELPMMDGPLQDIFGCASDAFGDGKHSKAPAHQPTAVQAHPRARPINLGMLGAQLRGAVSIQDRRSGLTKHRGCFVGSEAAAWLQSWLRQAGYPDSERDAVTLGNQLMDTGLFEHVTKDHIFKNRDLYYRFVLSPDDPDADAIRSAPVSPADDASPIAHDASMELDDEREGGEADPYASADCVRFSLDGTSDDGSGMFDAARPLLHGACVRYR